MNLNLWQLALVLGLTACGGDAKTDTGDDDDAADAGDADADSDSDSDADSDADTDVESGETGSTGSGFFEITGFRVDALFGYERNTGLVTITTAYGDLDPVISISLGNDAWAATYFDLSDDNYCSVNLILTDSTPVSFGFPTQWYGVAYDPAGGATSDCNTPGYELNPLDWAVDYVDLGFAQYNYGVAVGETWPDFPAQAPEDEPFLFGGYIETDLLQATSYPTYIGFAFALDANLQLVENPDGSLQLLEIAAPIFDGNQIQTGLYNVSATNAWIFQ
ncbi:MAG: hypothetical protein ABMB14_02620 [Myxococcota bacterium]